MPKSKRDKKVSLTKTTKKGLEAKQRFLEAIRNSVNEYNNIFVFSVDNMRNTQLKELREKWKHSRFFFGKNKVMTLGLGRKKEDEVEDSLHHISSRLKGQCGLLFTNESPADVISYFESYSSQDFARTGFKATETVHLEAGGLPDFPHSLEPHLRQLGLPTILQKGIVTLTKEHTVCKEGDLLTSEQARILKLLGNKMSTFKVTLVSMWSKGGKFKELVPVEKKKGKLEKENTQHKKKMKKSKKVKYTNDVEMKE
uniref:Ribosome assembly factor mrt4 n=2 Tax=Rhodnius prolixus TaxID=13249 RepID=R4G5E5_RHOPR